jgi:hypothetical protein
MVLKAFCVASGLISGIFGGFAQAADTAPMKSVKPAVDGLNGKLSFGGLYNDLKGAGSDTFFYSDGSVSIPIDERFGAQIDGAIAANGKVTSGGAGVHVFWRDPSMGLAGGYGEVVSTSGSGPSVYRYGAEAEVYFDRFSVEAFAGVQDASNIKPVFTGDLTLAFYPG